MKPEINKRFFLDTSAFFKEYLDEEGSDHLHSIFKQAKNGSVILCISIITISEVLNALDKIRKRRIISASECQTFGRVTQSAKISLIAKIPKLCMISILSKMDYCKPNMKPVNEPPRGRPFGGGGSILNTGEWQSSHYACHHSRLYDRFQSPSISIDS